MTVPAGSGLLPAGLDSAKHRKVAELIAISYRTTGSANAEATGSRSVSTDEWVRIAKSVARHLNRPVKDLGHVVQVTDWPATGPERLLHHANLPGTPAPPLREKADVAIRVAPGDVSPRTAADTALGARDRILDTADLLFTRTGIRAVGVQDILEHASVNRAAFYRHFPTRADLEIEYARRLCARSAATLGQLRRDLVSPGETLTAVVDEAVALMRSAGFRGDPLVNAASEYPDPHHPVRQLIRQHHAWYHEQLVALFEDAGHYEPAVAATRLEVTISGAVSTALTEQDFPHEELRQVLMAAVS